MSSGGRERGREDVEREEGRKGGRKEWMKTGMDEDRKGGTN